MSECVVRMKIPTRCDSCDFWHVCKNVADFGAARYFEEPRELFVGMKGCKIVCLLPEGHGRLGDLDELAAGCDSPYWCRWLSEIEDAPTIVPADTAERSET